MGFKEREKVEYYKWDGRTELVRVIGPPNKKFHLSHIDNFFWIQSIRCCQQSLILRDCTNMETKTLQQFTANNTSTPI